MPTPRPDEPFQLIIDGARFPTVPSATRDSSLIVVAIVRQVLPARWTTPDGGRPANPHDRANPRSIYRPVIVDVQQYIKGQESQPMLYIAANGGAIGQDYVRYEGLSYEFQVGEQTILFLAERARPRALRVDGQAVLNVVDRFRVNPDGRVTDGYRTMPFQQLLYEIAAVTPGAPKASPSAP